MRLAITVVDQVLASAAWYFPVLFVARAADPREFGVFLVTFGVLAMSMAVSRAMFGVVTGMDVGSPTDQSASQRTMAGVLVWSTASAAAFLVAAALVPQVGDLVALLGVAALLVMAQDLARYNAVAHGLPARALLADTIWLLPCVLGLASDLAGLTRLSAVNGVALWVASCAASLLVCCSIGLLARPQVQGSWRWWRRDARRRNLGADSLLSGLVPVANGWGAALVAGSGAVAAVRGAAMLFAPIATLMLAMTLAAVPEAHRRERPQALRLLLGLTSLLVLTAIAWGALALATPDVLGRALLGESWTVAEPVLPLISLEYAGLAMWTGGTALLRYASATSTILRLRLAYAPTAALLPVVALAISDDPRHFVMVLAILAWGVGSTAIASGLRASRT